MGNFITSSTMYDIPYLDNLLQCFEQNTVFLWQIVGLVEKIITLTWKTLPFLDLNTNRDGILLWTQLGMTFYVLTKYCIKNIVPSFQNMLRYSIFVPLPILCNFLSSFVTFLTNIYWKEHSFITEAELNYLN